MEAEDLVRAEMDFQVSFVGAVYEGLDIVVELVLAFVCICFTFGFLADFEKAFEEINGGGYVTGWWVY